MKTESIGDKVICIEAPRSSEYYCEVGEIFTIKKIIYEKFYKFEEKEGGFRIELFEKKSVDAIEYDLKKGWSFK